MSEHYAFMVAVIYLSDRKTNYVFPHIAKMPCIADLIYGLS